MEKLRIQTGVKTYEIEDENGNVLGTINIYPRDFNIGKRAKEAQKKIEEYINEAEILAVENEEDAIDKITEIDNKIKEQLDYIFNSKVSETVFKGLHCLDVVASTGKYFIESFLDTILPVLSKELDAAVKASEKNIEQYTGQVKKYDRRTAN
ncbi:hypothetical protein DFR55_10982 [Herbinix hemicellulosilytica]|uniref:Uncharacterized protein n=1 Tax=Herbinix hemicellulosilytica TaxID=1564487 RepID=A0A0H5SJF9_HERHM|nr:hypothetical protein [Herbinix hemicellulosilytica]RBP58867.1 hypothetical protein DFR55_10982 [Herbinix hemicellulosilytica]CRZ34926.1 hypothetical protein HHT355_1726 [Herbinix hemicellulosilytica]